MTDTPKTKHVHFALRVDDPTIQRIERISEWIAKKNPWLSKHRSHALRTILMHGLDAVEVELAAEQKAKTKPPTKTVATAKKGVRRG